jgi:hypothetical protein
VASKGGKVAQGLLQEGRDEGPLPPDVSGQQPRSTDVQVGLAGMPKQQQHFGSCAYSVAALLQVFCVISCFVVLVPLKHLVAET